MGNKKANNTERETETAVDETRIIDGTDGFLDINIKYKNKFLYLCMKF